MGKTVFSIIICLALIVIIGCEGPPNWRKETAYKKGPIASGEIINIEMKVRWETASSLCDYIIYLDGTMFKIGEADFRKAGGLKIGDKITVYYSFQAGYVIDKEPK